MRSLIIPSKGTLASALYVIYHLIRGCTFLDIVILVYLHHPINLTQNCTINFGYCCGCVGVLYLSCLSLNKNYTCDEPDNAYCHFAGGWPLPPQYHWVSRLLFWVWPDPVPRAGRSGVFYCPLRIAFFELSVYFFELSFSSCVFRVDLEPIFRLN